MARSRPGGLNLGLDRLNVNIWWQGYGGMRISQVMPRLCTMLSYADPPSILILHVSGNNIGYTRIGHLRIQVKDLIFWIKSRMPNTIIVWSQVLPRSSWRFSDDLKAMEKARYRLNNFISSLVIGWGVGIFITLI